MRCSIVIPVYDQAGLTRQCLEVLLGDRKRPEVEIVVVDDGSRDETREILSRYRGRIEVVQHTENQGFAAACNDGAEAATGDALLFLNNDTIPQPGWLDTLLDYARTNPHADIVGARLLFPDETIQHAGVVIDQYGFPKHVYSGFPAWHPAVNRSRRYQAVTAACTLVRRKLFAEIGGFDTVFRNGYEDVDFCLRAGAHGAQVHYCADSVLYHLESMSKGRFDHSAANERAFVERWGGRVSPDDFRYYVEDDLLGIVYEDPYPLRISLSPALGVVEGDDFSRRADQLLGLRSRRAFEMSKEIARLNAQLVESEAAGAPSAPKLLAEGSARWLSNSPGRSLVSVLMPVRNARDRIENVLPRVLGQDANEIVQVIGLDRGSSDGTVDVFREFDATVLDVGPALTRAGIVSALTHARGEIVVLLGEEATPADRHWLEPLVAPLEDFTVAATFSKLRPDDEADPATRRELATNAPPAPNGPITDPASFHAESTAIRADVLQRVPLVPGDRSAAVRWADALLAEGSTLIRATESSVHLRRPQPLDLLARGIASGRDSRNGEPADLERLLHQAVELVREDWRDLDRDARLEGDELDRERLDAALRRLSEAAGRIVGASAGLSAAAADDRAWIDDARLGKAAFGRWAGEGD